MKDDLISRKEAYDVLTEYYHHKTETQHEALREALSLVPSRHYELRTVWDRGEEMYVCPRCEAHIPMDQKFCGYCGTYIGHYATE